MIQQFKIFDITEIVINISLSSDFQHQTIVSFKMKFIFNLIFQFNYTIFI